MTFGMPKRGSTAMKIFMVLTVVTLSTVLVLLLSDSRFLNGGCNTKPILICADYDENSKLTGLEVVKPIQPYASLVFHQNLSDFNKCRERIQRKESTHLSKTEIVEKKKCIQNYARDERKDHDLFWSGTHQYIRRTHHDYLTSQSIILDVGGNVGDDAIVLLNQFSPYKYVILEPMKLLYRSLLKRFQDKSNVIIYNFGLATKNEQFLVNIEGTDGDATSVFKGSDLKGTCPLKVVNTTKFLTNLGLGCFEVDLLTINCEGCEFEVLEAILSSNVINYFRNIQFATHSKLKHLYNPVERYCEIQQKLSRTHKATYQYKFNWESWRRKDVFE